MRPRETEEAVPLQEPSPLPPATRSGGGLSSMVVRPSDSGGVGDVVEPAEVHAANDRRDSPRDLRRRGSPLDPRPRDLTALRRRSDSPQDLRHRDWPRNLRRPESPPPFHRRRSPAEFRRRGGPAGCRPRYQRFSRGSISPSLHPRLRDGHSEPEFDGPLGPHFGCGLQGGMLRDASPPYGPGRGGRSFWRGYDASGQGFLPFKGEYVRRNDLNLSPREGDWICQNPSHRYQPLLHGRGRTPRRGYFNSPSPRGSPPRIFAPPMDRGLRRDLGRHRSPPHGWGADGPRDFGFGSPPPGRVGRFVDHMRRERPDYHYELDYRGRGKFDRPVLDEWDRRDRGGDGFIHDRRGYDRCPPSSRDRWEYDSRKRSSSPIGEAAEEILHGPRSR